MINEALYDKTNPESIEKYAKKLIGHTFNDVLKKFETRDDLLFLESTNSEKKKHSYGSSARKGGLGNLIEEKYFGYKANSNPHADFEEAGVELKVTPYEIHRDKKEKRDKFVAGERLVLTMISFDQPVIFDFYKSHVWEKSKNILRRYMCYFYMERGVNNKIRF